MAEKICIKKIKTFSIGVLFLFAVTAGCSTVKPVTYVAQNPNILYPTIIPLKTAVFPTQNLTDAENAGIKVNELLLTRLYTTGFMDMINQSDIDKFLYTENIRWVNTLSDDQISAAKNILGADIIILSSVNEYSINPEPKAAINIRIIDANNKVTLFTGSHSLSASDRENAFDIGTLRTVTGVIRVILDELIVKFESEVYNKYSLAGISDDKKSFIFRDSKKYAKDLWDNGYKTSQTEKKEDYDIRLKQQIEINDATWQKKSEDRIGKALSENNSMWKEKLKEKQNEIEKLNAELEELKTQVNNSKKKYIELKDELEAQKKKKDIKLKKDTLLKNKLLQLKLKMIEYERASKNENNSLFDAKKKIEKLKKEIKDLE